MKIAIMQPYLFPYIGYFQLIKAVDKFIFYDDVNFIKNGWINRNRVLVNNQPHYLTVQLKGASPNKLIHEIEFTDNRPKLLRTLYMAYRKAPQFDVVWPLVEKCLTFETDKISDLAINSVKEVCNYLNIKTSFEISSISYPETKELEKAARLKEICFKNQAKMYINPIGGQELYDKNNFKNVGIELLYLKSIITEYNQSSSSFVPGLSIIDVMMWNSVENINEMLNSYDLI